MNKITRARRLGWMMFLGVSGMSVTSCAMVGPEFTTPKTPEVSQWVSANQLIADQGSGMTSRSAPVANWWQKFNDPVLNQLIQDAYSQNLSLQIAGARVFQARAQLGIAAGELYPQQQSVGAAVGYKKVSENLQFVSDIERFIDLDTNFTTSQVGFDAAWEIDVWGGLRRNVESATANLTAQIADYDDVLVSLTGDVAAAYINVRALEEAIGITRQNVALQEESLRLAELRFENGVTTELDVEQAKTILNETKAVVPSLQNDLQQSRNALSVLLAEPPGKSVAGLDVVVEFPSPEAKLALGFRPNCCDADLIFVPPKWKLPLSPRKSAWP